MLEHLESLLKVQAWSIVMSWIENLSYRLLKVPVQRMSFIQREWSRTVKRGPSLENSCNRYRERVFSLHGTIVERVVYLSTSGTIAVSDDPDSMPDETAESPFYDHTMGLLSQ